MPTYAEVQAMLRSLGLKRSEISIYWALHRADRPLSVREIIAETGLSEKTVRTALRDLIRHGYVRKRGKKRGTRYEAVSLRTIADRLKKRIEEKVSEILSRLQLPRA